MTNEILQTNSAFNYKILLYVLIGGIIIYLLASLLVSERLQDLQLETKLLISEQETRLASIAQTVASNGADDVIEQIIRDCSLPERIRFDELLSSLDKGLNRTQLTELERLFGRCGNFFAQRKSVMSARFEREIEIYEVFVEQLSNITKSDVSAEYKVSEWRNLAELEAKQSTLFLELVAVQDSIITLLLEGKAPTSEEVVTILQEATQIQESLIVANTQATSIRSDLISL